jgi:hypothetical protein
VDVRRWRQLHANRRRNDFVRNRDCVEFTTTNAATISTSFFPTIAASDDDGIILILCRISHLVNTRGYAPRLLRLCVLK